MICISKPFGGTKVPAFSETSLHCQERELSKTYRVQGVD